MKHIFLLTFYILILVFITSCEKTVGDYEMRPLRPSEEVLNAQTKFVINGTDYLTYSEYTLKYKSSNLFGEDDESIIIGFEDSNYIFTNDASLNYWVFNRATATEIRQKLDSAIMWQNYAAQRGMIDNEVATNQFTDSIAAVDLANRPPAEFFSGLYSNINYGGVFYWYPMYSFRPTFGSFNKTASSLADYFLLPKLNMLASKTWFRGSKFFFWSWKLIPDLNVIQFDNKASSKL